MKSDLGGESPRRYIVGAAECGEKVIQRMGIGDVDGGDLRAPSKSIPMEQIIVPDGDVEEMPWRDARRIAIVILASRRWYLDECRTEAHGSALRERRREGWSLVSTVESGLHLLVCGEAGQIDRRRSVCSERYAASDETTIVTPVESQPRSSRPGLVLQMGSLIVSLVMIDAKRRAGGGNGCASPTHLWPEKAS